MASYQLDTLPIEIVRRILIEGPPTNALAVSRVNQRLRSICIDPLLYPEIVKSRSEEWSLHTPAKDVHDLQWWSYDEKDWHKAARWALADMKLQMVWSNVNQPLSQNVASLLWLPELISQGHLQAISCSISNDVSTSIEGSLLYRNEIISRAAFHGTCRCLLFDTPVQSMDSSETSSSLQPQVCFNDSTWRSAMGSLIPGLTYSSWQSRSFLMVRHSESRLVLRPFLMFTTQNYEADLKRHELACMVLGVIMVAVFQKPLRNVLHSQKSPIYSSIRSILYPPTAGSIPFKTLYPKCPPPFSTTWSDNCTFSDNKTEPFLFHHLATMTSVEFLTAGTWIGYYNYANFQFGNQWDPIMDNIEFAIVSDEDNLCTVISQGNSIDKCGPFSLAGTIHKRSGRVEITKQYDNGQVWPWSAVMTPFGIVGSWGSEGWGGWLWLWKKDWSTAEEK